MRKWERGKKNQPSTCVRGIWSGSPMTLFLSSGSMYPAYEMSWAFQT